MSGLMLVFYARADQEGMERAIPYIEQIVQLPVTKENKFFVGSFHSWYLLYKVFIRGKSFPARSKGTCKGNYKNGFKRVLPYTRNY